MKNMKIAFTFFCKILEPSRELYGNIVIFRYKRIKIGRFFILAVRRTFEFRLERGVWCF